MNDTQWVFELEAMNKEATEKFEDFQTIFKWIKRSIIDLLGIGLVPVEDPDTGLLKMPGPDEYTPLALMIAREDVLKLLDERVSAYVNQESVRMGLERGEAASPLVIGGPNSGQVSFPELSPEELEAFMKDEGDIAFENAPEDVAKALNWGSSFDKAVADNLVLHRDSDTDTSFDGPPSTHKTIGQVRRDFINSQLNKTEDVGVKYEEVTLATGSSSKPKMKVTVEEV